MVHASITEGVMRTRSKLRKDLLVSVFDEFDESMMQLEPLKREEKYRKMSLSPFSFFRGSAYLFYFDATRQYFPYHTRADRPTWIQGDLHFENFGAFHIQGRQIVYDVNDFDEGYLGSYLYDVLRMSSSVALVGRQFGYAEAEQKELIQTYLRAYAKQIRRFAAGKDDPATFMMNVQTAKGPVRKLLRKLEKRKQAHFLEKVTAQMQDGRAFLENSELVVPEASEQRRLEQAWTEYLDTVAERHPDDGHYAIKDVAVKHGSGTASIGLDRYYLLIEGEKGHNDEDDTILEVKEVRVPVPAYFLPYSESFWAHFGHQGKRVVTTQQAMHHQADAYLGYLTVEGRDFYVRERSPYKKRLKPQNIQSIQDMRQVLRAMGKLTAKMHARADIDVASGILSYHSEQEIAHAIGSDTDGFARHIADWSYLYANQVERDYALFTEWIEERFGIAKEEKLVPSM